MITIIILVIFLSISNVAVIPTGQAVLGDAYTDATAIDNQNIIITSPARDIASAPLVATTTIEKPECDYEYTIPYIQTSSSFYAAVEANSSAIPDQGGVLFILHNDSYYKSVQFDSTYPYEANFTELEKDEYTLIAVIADKNEQPLLSLDNIDTAKRIGVGDIYVAIGDSVTEGVDGTSWKRFPITDWTEAPVRSLNSRNFPICGVTSTSEQITQQNSSEHIELNDHLNTFYNYPIFILNEGVGRSTTESYFEIMQTEAWQARVGELEPNKFLIHLGINDVNGNNQSAENLQLIINELQLSYNADTDNIFLAIPAAGNSWKPYINEVRISNKLPYAPDFKTLFADDELSLIEGVHPDAEGYTEMAKLWFESIRKSELK